MAKFIEGKDYMSIDENDRRRFKSVIEIRLNPQADEVESPVWLLGVLNPQITTNESFVNEVAYDYVSRLMLGSTFRIEVKLIEY